ncbi:MAG TPA: response regulator transcription factor [Solirubrobacteraceae bacterium]|jgi:DNA-binding NarL/FixJ family response regulator|nr:response regulator transcription factor [Solirubrobacteraceae bacterium]
MKGHLRLASGSETRASGARSIRVVLADGHALMRRSLRLLLDGAEEVSVVAEAADLTTAVRHTREQAPHVLILGLGMAHGAGLEVTRQIREEVPRTEIVVLTMEDVPGFAQQALEAGAIGFVLKDSADTELLPAVRRAAHGDEYVSSRLSAGLEPVGRARRRRGSTMR